MAKILILHYGGIRVNGKYQTLVFYEGLIQTLNKYGNDVLEIITDVFLERPWNGSNRLKPGINKSSLISDIKKFKPDFIISFNNSSIDGLAEAVSCPIAIWDADHIYHFNDLEKLKKNVNRYLFFCSQTSDIADCQNILGAVRERCYLMKPATSVISDETEKKYNISFIGTPFGNYAEKEKLHRHKQEYISLSRALVGNSESPTDLVKKYSVIPDADQTILDFGSAALRTNTLAHVAPLGLNLHGGDGWLEVGIDSSLDIFMAYNPNQVYSLKQTQDVYNASKIGLNINHTQAKSGYSWRVMDILASSAVLVSNYSKDLEDDLGELSGYIFYNTPQEAYELCARLLDDPSLRQRIVSQSNEIVKNRHTWDIRIGEMERIIGIRLTDVSKHRGQYHVLGASKYYKKLSLKGLYGRYKNVACIKLAVEMSFSAMRFMNKIKVGYILRFVRFITPYGLVKVMRAFGRRVDSGTGEEK